MPWKIKTWIPCEEEDVSIYRDRVEAASAVDSMSTMQPENIYRVTECDEVGEDI